MQVVIRNRFNFNFKSKFKFRIFHCLTNASHFPSSDVFAFLHGSDALCLGIPGQHFFETQLWVCCVQYLERLSRRLFRASHSVDNMFPVVGPVPSLYSFEDVVVMVWSLWWIRCQPYPRKYSARMSFPLSVDIFPLVVQCSVFSLRLDFMISIGTISPLKIIGKSQMCLSTWA